jgi:hypothetical protein
MMHLNPFNKDFSKYFEGFNEADLLVIHLYLCRKLIHLVGQENEQNSQRITNLLEDNQILTQFMFDKKVNKTSTLEGKVLWKK